MYCSSVAEDNHLRFDSYGTDSLRITIIRLVRLDRAQIKLCGPDGFRTRGGSIPELIRVSGIQCGILVCGTG